MFTLCGGKNLSEGAGGRLFTSALSSEIVDNGRKSKTLKYEGLL